MKKEAGRARDFNDIKALERIKEEFDMETIRHWISLSAEEKLNYLEKMQKILHKITPEDAKIKARKLKDEGF